MPRGMAFPTGAPTLTRILTIIRTLIPMTQITKVMGMLTVSPKAKPRSTTSSGTFRTVTVTIKSNEPWQANRRTIRWR